jgi:hypothetical protein
MACRRSEIPKGPIRVDLFFHASDEIGWLPLAEGYDVRSGAEPEKIRESAPVCEKTAGRAGLLPKKGPYAAFAFSIISTKRRNR